MVTNVISELTTYQRSSRRPLGVYSLKTGTSAELMTPPMSRLYRAVGITVAASRALTIPVAPNRSALTVSRISPNPRLDRFRWQ